MTSDFINDSVSVFSGDSDSPLGTVALPSDVTFGDCSVAADQSLGFVADGALQSKIWVIDLTFPPSLAAGTNPIELTSRVTDTALTADEQLLVVCDGNAAVAFDVATREPVDSLPLGAPCAGIDVCDDDSVLIATAQGSTVRRLTLDGSGGLTDTGESLSAAVRPSSTSSARRERHRVSPSPT